MKVHIMIPYALDKNLGMAYNQAMALIPDGDWACLMDYDAMLLSHDAGRIIHKYVEYNPTAGILTAKTNRVHPLSKQQLYNGSVSDNYSFKDHLQIADFQKRFLYQTTELSRAVSGFLMVISKKQWQEIPFNETGKCLGVDTDYSLRLKESGKKILVMDGLYVFHTYRLLTGINSKSHLL